MIDTQVPIKIERVDMQGAKLKVRFQKDFSLVVSFLHSPEFPGWVHIQSQRLGMNPAEVYIRLLNAYRSYCKWVALKN